MKIYLYVRRISGRKEQKMKRKKMVWLALCFLAFAALFWSGKSVQAAGKVTNNGDDVVQQGSYVYYLAPQTNGYKLCRIKTNNKSMKVLDSWTGSYNKGIFLSGSRIYYQKSDGIYANPLNKKSPKKIVEGTLLGVYGSNIYYAKGAYNSTQLWTIGTNGKKPKQILSGSYEAIGAAAVSGKVLILNAEVAGTAKCEIVYVDMAKKKAKVLTTEGKLNSYDFQEGKVIDACIYKNVLYYACGTIQGTGNVFSGHFKKIGLNGKGKKTIAEKIGGDVILPSLDMLLYPNGGYIYYYKDGVKRYKISTGKSTKLPGEVLEGAAGKYGYYVDGKSGTTKAVIYRFDLSKGKSTAKKFASVTKNKNYTCTLGDVVLVGDYLYFDISSTDFSSGYNWRGEYKGTATYKMTTKGKSIKKLN